MGKLLLSISILALSAGQAGAAENWSCSIIEDGKPQVIKIAVASGKATVSDWRSRLMKKYELDVAPPTKLLNNDKNSLVVVVGEIAVDAEQGHMHDVSLDILAIDKYTNHMTLTTVSTANPAREMKGNCAP